MEYPVPRCPVLIEDRKAVAHLADRDVTISAPAGVLRELLRLCDGRTTLQEVRKQLAARWHPRDAGALIDALAQQGVLADAGALASRRAASIPHGSHASFRWVDFDARGPAPTFFLGMAERKDRRGNVDFCWGRSHDPQEAYDKATAETVERSACATPSGIYKAAFAGLDHALDPRQVAAYLPRQYRSRGFPFAPFSETAQRWWKDGRDHFSGRKISVPAELVYFRDTIRAKVRHPCTAATTSGVAAFTDREGALERAVLELCERDAFMRAWLGRVQTPRITERSLPRQIRARIDALARAGLSVAVKTLPQDLVPVVLVFAQHRRQAFTAVGTAAGYDAKEALDSALMECESVALVRLRNTETRSLGPSQVESPADHGDFYAQRRYFRSADFLARGGPLVPLQARGKSRSWSELLRGLRRRRLRLISVDMTRPGSALASGARLFVMRAIVPGLVPISFGYGTEPMGISGLARVSARLTRPHPLA